MAQTKSKALLYAEENSFLHDISHCNPDQNQITGKCYECKRYAAHLQLGLDTELSDGLYSYLSEPKKTCVDKNYKLFLELKGT
jgi:hypothetical protein